MITNRYTGFIDFDGTIEEIDVDAVDLSTAYELINEQLRSDYDGDGCIIHVEKRIGLYW